MAREGEGVLKISLAAYIINKVASNGGIQTAELPKPNYSRQIHNIEYYWNLNVLHIG
jgi:hypothetical protein